MYSTHLITKSTFKWSTVLMLSMVLILPMSSIRADEPEVDPSSRVARISYVQGSVSVQLAHTDDWIQARINRPLTNRDQVWTDDASRAELQIGMATVHLNQNTQLGLMELSDNVLQLQLNQGVLNINVRGIDNDDTIEIDTPSASITIPEPGNYRIEVSDQDNLTIIQVRDGSAEVAGERQRYSVRENEQLRLRGSKRLNAQFDDLDRMDEFDRWVASRNARSRNATAARYVDSNVIGYEDLDDYGYWRWEAGFGDVWYPNRVVSGWSPYRYGHWDWIAPWGWTWIDDAPWGFAPFHYGRWTEIHHHWCWVPGRREIRAVYAPALVAWVGTPHLSVSINVNGGSIGWIPLGPREVFRPHYHASAVYLSRVNIGGSMLNRDEFEHEIRRDRRDVFANRRAVSVVAAATFTSAATVHRNLITVDARTLNPMESLNQFRPDRAALVGGSHTIQPPVRIINREVVAQRTPAPLVPRPELPARHNVDVGDSVHMINPISPRRGLREDRDETRGDRRFTPPSQNDGLRNDNLREDTGRSDRWGRDGTRFENRQIERGDNNEPQRHEGRVNPPQERRDTVDPNANQQRIDPPQQNQQQEPERRRIGPWVREEQQLRPEPQQQQRNQAPPVNPPPPPRADPPRTFTPPPAPPPPQNDPPPNNQGGERPHRDRREIR